MIWDNLLIALQAIRANKMRSLLTMLGIIIGVAAVIAVVSIVQGLDYVISTQFEGVGVTYIMVFPRQDQQDPDLAGREVTLTYDDGLAIMERASGIKYFNPVFFRGEQTRSGSRRHATMLLGVGPFHQEVSQSLGGPGPVLLRPRPPASGAGVHGRPGGHRRARTRRAGPRHRPHRRQLVLHDHRHHGVPGRDVRVRARTISSSSRSPPRATSTASRRSSSCVSIFRPRPPRRSKWPRTRSRRSCATATGSRRG